MISSRYRYLHSAGAFRIFAAISMTLLITACKHVTVPPGQDIPTSGPTATLHDSWSNIYTFRKSDSNRPEWQYILGGGTEESLLGDEQEVDLLPAKVDLFHMEKIEYDGKTYHTFDDITDRTRFTGDRRNPVVVGPYSRRIPAGDIVVVVSGEEFFDPSKVARPGRKTYAVESKLSFKAREGADYYVRGRLRKGSSEIWIEDASGKIVSKPAGRTWQFLCTPEQLLGGRGCTGK